jgi:hypothetical protein
LSILRVKGDLIYYQKSQNLQRAQICNHKPADKRPDAGEDADRRPADRRARDEEAGPGEAGRDAEVCVSVSVVKRDLM